jgi:hypothetical protein
MNPNVSSARLEDAGEAGTGVRVTGFDRVAPENTLEELESGPQVVHFGLFGQAEHPVHGTVRMPLRPVRVDGSREISMRVPPELGEDTAEVLRTAGLDEALAARLAERAYPTRPPRTEPLPPPREASPASTAGA